MRFSSPIASTFSSHRSRSLALRRSVGLVLRLLDGDGLPPAFTLISMTLTP